MKVMNRYELFALAHFLSEFPEGWDYDRVLETLEANDDDCRDNIVVWEPYEDWGVGELCEMIDDMKRDLEHNFLERQV